jgi:A/G-specific adenine glycosylase
MLQQTQVGTVIPYWERWMARLPDLASLAAEPPANLLKLWEGLGYYRRARNMQAAARLILERGGRTLPNTLEGWLELPGIGPYTAGAIMSIAFNQPLPAVDGNVIRVLSRLDGIETPSAAPATLEQIRVRASALVQAAHESASTSQPDQTPPCSALNQSLMELGATVCTPRQPACDPCPIREWCNASRTGRTDRIPALTKPPATTHLKRCVLVLHFRGEFLIRRRPHGGHNEELWEFPSFPEPADQASVPELAFRELLAQCPEAQPLGTLSHSITRYRIRLQIVRIDLPRRPKGLDGEWVERASLAALPFPSAHRKIILRHIETSATLPHPNSAALPPSMRGRP